MAVKEKTDKMREIRDEIVSLKESPLYQYRIENRSYPVIGEGNHDAEIMLIGEAPGKREAETGRPFCGAAGKLLDELLASVGIPREDVYITNIVKDRPPDNRDPLPDEIALYAPLLDRQTEIIEPKTIATLGRFSMEYILRTFGLEHEIRPMGTIHGTSFDVDAPHGAVRIVPLYHPAAALYNGGLRETLFEDFKQLQR